MDELLAAIVEHPEDDAPRLVWADAVGGERGELVVIQCDLARGGLSLDERVARRRRERELLARHGPRWANLEQFAFDWQFRRGFVEAVACDAGVVLGMADRLFGAAPLVRSLKLGGLDGTMAEPSPFRERSLIAELYAVPELARIDRLAIHAAVDYVEHADTAAYDFDQIGFGDLFAEVLAESSILGRLRDLVFAASGLSSRGVHALVASGKLANLEQLRVGSNVGPDALPALVNECPRLRGIDTWSRYAFLVLAPVLPPLEDLELLGPGAEELAALAASASGPTLRRLVVEHHGADDLHALGMLPRLEALDLEHVVGPLPLATVELPALRVLRLTGVDQANVIALARAFGPQLELLEARGPRLDVSAWGPLVAGEVRCNPPAAYGDGFTRRAP